MQKEGLLQFLRFQAVGIAGFLATNLTYVLLVEVKDAHYVVSSVVGYLMGNVVTFALNKKWTFENKDGVWLQLATYFSFRVMMLVANGGLMYVAVQHLHLWHGIAQLFPIAVLALPSYLSTKFVFKQQRAAPALAEAVT